MKIFKHVTQSEVFNHWERVEKISIGQRADIIFPLVAYADLVWNSAQIEPEDLEKLYIISSDDWKAEGLCVPDFKLITAINNYNQSTKNNGKYADIKIKEQIFTSNINSLDKKFILVSEDKLGPYTIIEGNKRAIALGNIGKLVGIEIYIGVSNAIRNYVWSRHAN